MTTFSQKYQQALVDFFYIYMYIPDTWHFWSMSFGGKSVDGMLLHRVTSLEEDHTGKSMGIRSYDPDVKSSNLDHSWMFDTELCACMFISELFGKLVKQLDHFRQLRH